MRELPKGCLLNVCLFSLAIVVPLVIIWVAQPTTETMSRHTSPNGRWNISEEFEWRKSCFRIILRDAAGKEIARSEDRFVKSYLIDAPSDHQLELQISNDVAGEKGRPIWRLDAAQNKWHIDSSDEPVKLRVPADQ